METAWGLVSVKTGDSLQQNNPCALISASCGIHVAVEHQLLLCNGRRIDMNRSLQSQGVGNDSTIVLTLKLNGGAGIGALD